MWLFFYLKLHEYTRDIENLQYSNQIQRKKGKKWRQCGSYNQKRNLFETAH